MCINFIRQFLHTRQKWTLNILKTVLPSPAGIINRHKKTFLALSISFALFPPILHAQTITIDNEAALSASDLNFGKGTDNKGIEITGSGSLTITGVSEDDKNGKIIDIINTETPITSSISLNGTITLGTKEDKTKYQYIRIYNSQQKPKPDAKVNTLKLSSENGDIISNTVFFVDGFANAELTAKNGTIEFNRWENSDNHHGGQFPASSVALGVSKGSYANITAQNIYGHGAIESTNNGNLVLTATNNIEFDLTTNFQALQYSKIKAESNKFISSRVLSQHASSIDIISDDIEVVKYIHGETLIGNNQKGYGLILVDGYPLSFYKESNKPQNYLYPIDHSCLYFLVCNLSVFL